MTEDIDLLPDAPQYDERGLDGPQALTYEFLTGSSPA